MKAAIYNKYGPPEVLHIADQPKPTPLADELLVRIYASSVNSGDRHMRKADPFIVRFFAGLRKPKQPILGTTFAGVVEATGADVTKFQVGERVFGSVGMKMGCYAEYTTIKETDVVTTTPDNINDQHASAVPFGGLTAHHFLSKSHIQAGQKVMVYGASGAVGTAAVQLAKQLGAEVTGVCSTSNKDMVLSLGADTVIDYTQQSIGDADQKYDVIFETVGKADIHECLKILSPQGVLLQAAAGLSQMIAGLRASITTKKKVIGGLMKQSQSDIEYLASLVEAGNFSPVIDTVYPLEDIATAHTRVEAGHKKGNIVVTI